MNTTTHSKVTAEQLKDFSPVEGTWDSNIPNSDDRDAGQIAADLEMSIHRETGFKVKVKIFRENGREFHDDCPPAGSFLATRI